MTSTISNPVPGNQVQPPGMPLNLTLVVRCPRLLLLADVLLILLSELLILLRGLRVLSGFPFISHVHLLLLLLLLLLLVVLLLLLLPLPLFLMIGLVLLRAHAGPPLLRVRRPSGLPHFPPVCS